MSETNSRQKLYEEVTNQIIEDLASGTVPWVKPWAVALPRNAVSQQTYNGVNILLLWRAMNEKQFKTPSWLTYKQALELGGHIKKGEKGIRIVYASSYQKQNKQDKDETSKENREEKTQSYSFLKAYTVFNVEQAEALPEHLYQLPTPRNQDDPRPEIERFIETIKAEIKHGGARAFYRPSEDFIGLPYKETFTSISHYYATSLHEHAHWTGHSSRLKRNLENRFGNKHYAAEELIAELATAFLCAYLNIKGYLQHADYIANWLELLSNDKRALFHAAARATEACEYLKSLQVEQSAISS